MKEYRLALQIFQSDRLRRDYADLAEIPQYTAVGEFFFTEIYGPRDFSARDSGARRLQSFLHLVPGVAAEDVQQVLYLLDLTYRLDLMLAKWMAERKVVLPFDEALYERAYHEVDTYDQRLEQLWLIDRSLRDVFRLSRSGLLGRALRGAGLVARFAGLGEIHAFLMAGYDALRPVEDIEHFTVTVFQRELARLNRIYEREEHNG